MNASHALAEGTHRELVTVASSDVDGDSIPDRDDDEIKSDDVGLRLEAPSAAARGDVPTMPQGLAVFASGKKLRRGASIPKTGDVRLVAREPGRFDLDIMGARHLLSAVEVKALDGRGREVDLARSHASIERTPPQATLVDPVDSDVDVDALSYLVIGSADDLPARVTFTSVPAPSAKYSSAKVSPVLDVLRNVPLASAVCPEGTKADLVCATTPPIRAVMDDLDRRHPLSADRSIKVELGGSVSVGLDDKPAGVLVRVGGPRETSVGPIDRFRARLRVKLLRLGVGGPPPIGNNDADAVERVRDEIGHANMIWGSCGIGFGPPELADVKLVDPPPPHLLSVGCDAGVPASGGSVRFEADGRLFEVPIEPGTKPEGAARVVARTLEKAGFHVAISEGAPISAATYAATDLVIRKRNGDAATITPPRAAGGLLAPAPLSTDATLSVCIGRVDSADGLTHFTDANAIAGTLEERALIKAFDDGDPATIEVYVVPSFGGDSRIGESFIFADGGAIKDVIIEDRAGLRANRASFTLAHEIGHVLLDQPGHPDDFGIDTPTRLMDADAVNASAFGPRRLDISECERAIRQSGPGSTPRLLAYDPLLPVRPAR